MSIKVFNQKDELFETYSNVYTNKIYLVKPKAV